MRALREVPARAGTDRRARRGVCGTRQRVATPLLCALVAACTTLAIPAGVARASSDLGGTYIASNRTGAAMLQLLDASGHLVGSYHSVEVEQHGAAYSVVLDQCEAEGTVHGALIVTLSSCTRAGAAGAHFGRLRSGHLVLDFSGTGGTQQAISFAPASVATYDSAVAGLHLYATQMAGLSSYLALEARTPRPFFQPVEGEPTRVGSTWFDVVASQTNAAMTHAGAVADLEVLRWNGTIWVEIRSFPLSSNTGPVPGTPTLLRLRDLVAYAVPLTWMSYDGFEVAGAARDGWRLVPFPANRSIAPNFVPTKTVSLTATEPSTVTERRYGCLQDTSPCGMVTTTYTYDPDRRGGPGFVVQKTSSTTPSLLAG